MNALGMTYTDVFDWVTKKEDVKRAVRNSASDSTSSFRKSLARLGAKFPLSEKACTALLVHQNATESQCQFIRSYFGAIPSVKQLRRLKKEFLHEMPPITVLHHDSTECIELPHSGMRGHVPNSANIECARISLLRAIETQWNVSCRFIWVFGYHLTRMRQWKWI